MIIGVPDSDTDSSTSFFSTEGMADSQQPVDAPMAGTDGSGFDTIGVSLSAQDLRDLLQLVAERRQQPANVTVHNR